jgi:hypothetical protein
MRNELVVKITDDNRDKDKTFLIVEMSAYDLEWFAVRTFQALGTSGVPVSPDVVQAGALGLVLLGYQTFIGSAPPAVKPLMDEMLQCVWSHPQSDVRVPWNPQLVEEISTLKLLREKWLFLHTGFTLAGLVQTLNEAISAKLQMARTASSQNTSTSPDQLAQS